MLLVRAAITFAWLFVSLALTQESGELVSSNSNSENNDLDEIRNTINQLQTDLRETQLNGESENSLQKRIQSLEKAYEDIARRADNLKRENQNSNITTIIGEIQITQNLIRSKLQSLNERFIEQQNKKTLQEKIQDIVLNIKADEFGKAKDQISQLDSNYKSLVVQSVYDYQSVNFKKLITFSEFLENKTLSFVILNELWKEMKRHGHLEIYNLIDLYKTIQKYVTDDMKSNALTIQTELLEQIKTVAIEILKKQILDGNYKITEMIENLIHSLTNFNENLLDDIQRKVIDDVFDEADKVKLVDFMCGKHNPSEIVVPAVQIFQKLQNNINDPAMMHIAGHLKWALAYGKDLSVIKKNSGQETYNKLPETVRILFSGKTICIKLITTNVPDMVSLMFGGHFDSSQLIKIRSVSANTPYDDDGRRNVLLTETEQGIKWNAEHQTGSTFAFVNADFSEYMYAAVYGPFYEVSKERRVFTYMSGEFVNKAEWIIELYNNEVLIKNEHFNEYLCAGLTYIHTSMKEIDPREHRECRWTIESCP